MNKPVFIAFLILSASQSIKAQENLVPNGDFEFYTQCPDDATQLNFAYPWYQPSNGTSDYFNTCTDTVIIQDVRVPANIFGYQFPRSGNGYAGFDQIYTLNLFEYLAVHLKEPLEIGKEYCVSFWLSLADSSCTSVNRVGAFFSIDSIQSNNNLISVLPQVTYNQFITQKTDWIEVSGIYLANGGEKFLAIGTFDTIGIDTLKSCDLPYKQTGSYRYIDDVSVKLSINDCSSLPFDLIEVPNIFTPNDDGDNDLWKVESNEKIDVSIFNRWGGVVYENDGFDITWDGSNLSEGIYYYILRSSEHQKTGFIQLIR